MLQTLLGIFSHPEIGTCGGGNAALTQRGIFAIADDLPGLFNSVDTGHDKAHSAGIKKLEDGRAADLLRSCQGCPKGKTW